ncbi:MAG: anti-anti-sigma factor [Geobacillus sp.]|nr:MAG: anti-anti-sigma factor [Geobacillus sp.]
MDRRISTLELEMASSEQFGKILLKGKLVYNTQQLARQMLEMALSEIKGDVVVMDVSNLLFIDSTGLALLVHFLKKEVAKKKKVIFTVSANKTIEKLLLIAKFHKLFPIVESEQDIIPFFASSPEVIADQKTLMQIWTEARKRD